MLWEVEIGWIDGNGQLWAERHCYIEREGAENHASEQAKRPEVGMVRLWEWIAGKPILRRIVKPPAEEAPADTGSARGRGAATGPLRPLCNRAPSPSGPRAHGQGGPEDRGSLFPGPR